MFTSYLILPCVLFFVRGATAGCPFARHHALVASPPQLVTSDANNCISSPDGCTQDHLTEATNMINSEILNPINIEDEDNPIAKLVRFAFHSCYEVGCNGCFSTENPDNDGMQDIFSELNTLYDEFTVTPKLSRADFWRIAEVEAVYKAVEPQYLDMVQDIVVHNWGTYDCSTSPTQAADAIQLPNPNLGIDHVIEGFGPMSAFQLSELQVAALILGGHSLGEFHRQYSGYIFPWDGTETTIDNQFILDMINVKYTQKTVVNKDYEWINDPNHEYRAGAINTDMCFLYDFGTPDEDQKLNGYVSKCPNDPTNCGITPGYGEAVHYWARNETSFIETFSTAFNQMANSGMPNMQGNLYV